MVVGVSLAVDLAIDGPASRPSVNWNWLQLIPNPQWIIGIKEWMKVLFTLAKNAFFKGEDFRLHKALLF